MRVAIITESFPPDVNGVAHCVLRVAELLAGYGHHPLVIAPRPPGGRMEGDDGASFPVVRVPAVPLPGYPSFRLGLPSRRVRAALIRHRAEVVHLASPVFPGAHGAAVARRLGLPAVAVYQTDLPSYARAYRLGRAGEAFAWRWLRGIHNGAARTLAPSTVTATGLLGRGIGNVWLWGRGVDTREPANLNALSRPSGNLRRSGGLPNAGLKVRSRLSQRNERTKPYHGSELGARPMSQTYDPNYPEQGQGYMAGPGFAGGAGNPGGYPWGGFASEPPPPPPRRSHKRGLIITAAVALAAGATAGGLLGSMNHPVAGTATATSQTVLSASQIASRVDPALVDIVSTLGYQQAASAGTGIVLTSNGEVLTNNHVIRGATSIKATDVGNGRTYTATVVGYDASSDVAVLQLQNASGLTTASLGDSSTVKTGDSVVALGNAGGQGGTPSVAAGTVTGLDQSITARDELSGASEELTGLIETDANIQPGDSGGPLVNVYGQVIGMNTAASSGYQFQAQSGQTEAYAIPIDTAESIANKVEAGTTTSDIHIGATAFLGVQVASAGQGFGGFGDQGGSASGATVAGTVSGSPAAEAGLTQGDQITAIGGQSISTAKDVAHALVKYHPGDKISISWVDTNGQSHTATVTLATGPAA